MIKYVGWCGGSGADEGKEWEKGEGEIGDGGREREDGGGEGEGWMDAVVNMEVLG